MTDQFKKARKRIDRGEPRTTKAVCETCGKSFVTTGDNGQCTMCFVKGNIKNAE